jgi:hypothetical protein
MATPAEIIDTVASLQNDTEQQVYTDEACLPYLNIALRRLQEKFQVNDIPVTKEVSAVIEIDAGVSEVGFSTAPPLPTGLVEIKQLWESPRDLEQWVPMSKRDFIPHYLENGTLISQFLLWAWIDQKIIVIPSNADNDLKLDYVKKLFTTLTIADINIDIDVINVQSFLEFKTAAFCAMFIGEDSVRAGVLDGQADDALEDSMGISIKGRQPIIFRRRPFRATYKSRTIA